MSLRFQPNCTTIWSLLGPMFSCILEFELPSLALVMFRRVYTLPAPLQPCNFSSSDTTVSCTWPCPLCPCISPAQLPFFPQIPIGRGISGATKIIMKRQPTVKSISFVAYWVTSGELLNSFIQCKIGSNTLYSHKELTNKASVSLGTVPLFKSSHNSSFRMQGSQKSGHLSSHQVLGGGAKPSPETLR